MSRRKQSNPRQFRRGLENGLEEDQIEGVSGARDSLTNGDPSEEGSLSEGTDPENLSVRDQEQSSSHEDGSPRPGQKGSEDQDMPAGISQTGSQEWDGPRELEMVSDGADQRVRSTQALPVGTTWGPFPGKIEQTTGGSDAVPVVLSAGPRWLLELSWLAAEDNKNNCIVYSKGGQLWCTTVKPLMERETLHASTIDVSSQLQALASEGMYPARLLDSIQLLPQQAAMASILPNAIVNKDIFPCKACGIWFRSERNLQAHLMYYCSGRLREVDTMVAERNSKNGSHVTPRVCPFPQCNMSFSGAHALEMHLLTHNSTRTEDPVSTSAVLKCTICNHTADTLMSLQQHILSHLSQVGLRCDHCSFCFQTATELARHQDLHGHGGGKTPREGDTRVSPGGGGGSTGSPRAGHKPEYLVRRDARQSPGQNKETNTGVDIGCTERELSTMKTETNSGNQASFSYTKVKSEPSSPRQASSPVQPNITPAFPMGPFVPHVPFPQDITAAPQASEILAKMSELVHRRLRHGGSNYPPMVYSNLVPKGATCFECNITFGNLDNYLVHKKHYCNSRWQQVTKPHEYSNLLDQVSDAGSPRNGSSLVGMLSTHPSELKGHQVDPTRLPTSMFDPFQVGGKLPDDLSPQAKKASTPTGAEERPNCIQADLKSPKISPVQNELDPSGTTCAACNITFSRNETFMVHKQYYCATRHDPPMKRANALKGPAAQKSVRARKRRKAYEMTTPDQDHMPTMPPPPFLGIPTMGNPCITQQAMESFRDQFHMRYNIYHNMVPKHPEASLTVTKSALVSKCNALAREELDVPIDLSKKCLPQFNKLSQSPPSLLDYHECAVCKISFNKVEDYLAHKQNSCPGTSVDSKLLLDIKKESCNPDISTKSIETYKKNSSPDITTQNALVHPVKSGAPSDDNVPVKEETKDTFISTGGYPGMIKKMRREEQIWPYYEIKAADYATGMLMMPNDQREHRKSPNEGSEGEKDQPVPDQIPNPLPKNKSKTLDVNGYHKTEEKPMDVGKPDSSPPREEPSSTSDPESPVHPKKSLSPLLMSKTEEVAPGVKRGANGSISAGNVKYCRPCDIQFNNLSNFITHKKFYCSSHTAEHVK
ncbi:zinc finger protein ZFPM2b [Clupea harengus]|uniref:Zinc finger protein ZFPM2b n=1 Tax=Clupea harengus TaxID=7950 RepID=A0A6P8H4B2_CLUHA|nr:zinc finger protein ZFPM2b [Clupea harengus]